MSASAGQLGDKAKEERVRWFGGGIYWTKDDED